MGESASKWARCVSTGAVLTRVRVRLQHVPRTRLSRRSFNRIGTCSATRGSIDRKSVCALKPRQLAGIECFDHALPLIAMEVGLAQS
jgi:hypothetical protein